ncbi:hypothetical protein [Chenggangzhangella methanolivorans]|uniref:Uncharacterized protein n=1 Tax=Chenggangzhangella methanolivorans TaxID=1437009 RepID=A0A9E6RB48_9HYPH|nr:hypothetical protein [Chenggangzhangella methanolivorans]QZO00600.1 hypothetical protein K6K41_02445 [Chenggangzhangella methanolivorans]
MRRSSMPLAIVLALACHALGVGPVVADERRPGTSIAAPYDQRPGAVTRPSGQADRDWRRGRRSPEIVMTPQRSTYPRQRFEAPRYDARGRRLNVPGRPDTYDGFGRARALQRPGPAIAPSGPTVRTDAATRINQYKPR